MVPERFAVEYPLRCLELLNMLEPQARRAHLVGSFSLLVGAAAFVIPYERLQRRHPLKLAESEGGLSASLARFDSKKSDLFLTATAWRGVPLGEWRFSRIMKFPEYTSRWEDEDGSHPMSTDAKNSIETRRVGEVLRVLRNALAHGNVVYLDESGFETRGKHVQSLGFLSRYEESAESRAVSETYRLVVTTEENFLQFLKVWVVWLATFKEEEWSFSMAAE
jgi:hypothetical protein